MRSTIRTPQMLLITVLLIAAPIGLSGCNGEAEPTRTPLAGPHN